MNRALKTMCDRLRDWPVAALGEAAKPIDGWKRRPLFMEPARHALSSSDGAHTLRACRFAPRLVCLVGNRFSGH